MIEAIVRQELLLGSRRTRLHLFRWVYAGWLICQVGWFFLQFQVVERERYYNQNLGADLVPFQPSSSPSVIGGWFCETFILQQLILLVLAVPPLVCGAIADEKRRGTLIYLLTTDLDTRHILLGKLIGRMVQVLALMSAGVPLFALFAGFAGLHPVPLLLLGLVLVPPLFALASASLLASVLCRQTRDAVLALYALGALGFGLAWFFPGGLQGLDPRWVMAPIWGQRTDETLSDFGGRFLLSLGVWGGLGLASMVGALAWLRPIYRRELENAGDQRPTWYAPERTRVVANPVSWREREVEGLSPFPLFRRMPLWLACVLVALITTLSSVTILAHSMPTGVTAGDFLRALLRVDLKGLAALLPGADLGFLVQSVVVLLIASFVVGVRASGAITGERERFTWESLLLTRLSEKELIQGKLWGILSSSFWYLLAYAAPALCLAVLGGVAAFFWTLIWLAVTVLAMYFIGAAGLWSSVRSSTSWRSLLSTMGFGYLGGVLIFLISSPLIMILAGILMALLLVADALLKTQIAVFAARGLSTYWTLVFVSACIGLATIFFVSAKLFLGNARRWIADRERTRYWEDDPGPPIRRRRRRSDRELDIGWRERRSRGHD
jgi:ABC-type transport system involved in multi-copper enzyme maturation permease subunit